MIEAIVAFVIFLVFELILVRLEDSVPGGPVEARPRKEARPPAGELARMGWYLDRLGGGDPVDPDFALEEARRLAERLRGLYDLAAWDRAGEEAVRAVMRLARAAFRDPGREAEAEEALRQLARALYPGMSGAERELLLRTWQEIHREETGDEI